MAKERTSVHMQAQIQRMAEQGYSVRAIARALKVSRKTVGRSLDHRRPQQYGIPVLPGMLSLR